MFGEKSTSRSPRIVHESKSEFLEIEQTTTRKTKTEEKIKQDPFILAQTFISNNQTSAKTNL